MHPNYRRSGLARGDPRNCLDSRPQGAAPVPPPPPPHRKNEPHTGSREDAT